MKVLLIGHYGRGNLGDDAMLEGIRQAFPANHELSIMARTTIPGLPTFDESPLTLIHAIRQVEWVWMGGGTYIHDEATNLRFRYTGLMKVLGVVLIAKILRRKVALVGMGLGPVRRKWKKLFVSFIFQIVDYISLRDMRSTNELDKCVGVCKGNANLTFDSCIGIKTRLCASRRSNRYILALNVLPYNNIYHNNAADDVVLTKVICGALHDVFRDRDLEVRIFTFNIKADETETKIIRETASRLSDWCRTEVESYDSPETVISHISRCDAMLSMRYHGAMMAYIARIPQTILAYHPKCMWLAEEIKLDKRSVVNIRTISRVDLANAMVRMRDNPTQCIAGLPRAEANARFLRNYFPGQFRPQIYSRQSLQV